MAEEEHASTVVAYRVATVGLDAPWKDDGGGPGRGHRWVEWTLHRPVFPNRPQAEGYAEAALRAGARNAVILEQRAGAVQIPDWLRVREEEPEERA